MFHRAAKPFALALFLSTGPAFAVLDEDEDSPPEPTETTTTCTDGQVWDTETRTCVDAESRLIDDDTRYAAAREFAYAGQFAAAGSALDAMSEGDTDRVLTYRGFLARKSGDMDTARIHYMAAIRANPDNLLARSYMGMVLVLIGERDAAQRQLAEIRSRGGAGGWPEQALAQALAGGENLDY